MMNELSHCGDTDNKLLLNVSHCFQSLDPLRGSTFLVLFTDIFLTIFSHHWQLCTSRFINVLFCLHTVSFCFQGLINWAVQNVVPGILSRLSICEKTISRRISNENQGKTIYMHFTVKKNIVHFFCPHQHRHTDSHAVLFNLQQSDDATNNVKEIPQFLGRGSASSVRRWAFLCRCAFATRTFVAARSVARPCSIVCKQNHLMLTQRSQRDVRLEA